MIERLRKHLKLRRRKRELRQSASLDVPVVGIAILPLGGRRLVLFEGAVGRLRGRSAVGREDGPGEFR